MHVIAGSRRLEVTGGGAGIVVHAGLVLLRQLADRTGLTGACRGRWPAAGCWCMFGPVASVPTAWRTLAEIASGGEKTARKVVAAVNAARRPAWAAIEARHGGLPGVRVADRVLAGVTCIWLDAFGSSQSS